MSVIQAYTKTNGQNASMHVMPIASDGACSSGTCLVSPITAVSSAATAMAGMAALVVVDWLKAGQTIALISDAGTPGISDPGFFLAREAAQAGVTVQTLPGATACVPALVSSGLPCDRFCFEGFLPQKKGRNTRLRELEEETRTMVFYESPYRLLKTLTQFAEVFGTERQVSVAREISKIHEEHVRGTIQEAIEHFTQTTPRGEIVIVLAGNTTIKNKSKQF